VVLLDANALFLPFRHRLPLEQEVARWWPGVPLAVPTSVLRELDRLVARRTAHAAPARALAGGFRAVPTDGRGDRAVVRLAVELGAPVVTADRLLAARLRREGISVLVPRDRARLELQRGEPPARRAATGRRRRTAGAAPVRGTVKRRTPLERNGHAR
jgi:rRNA-processing protein FCF1